MVAEASSWSHFFASLGEEFPPAGSSQASWEQFEHEAYKVPGLLVVLGACTAVLLPMVLCCCPPLGKYSRGARGRPPFGGFGLSLVLTLACLIVGLVANVRLGGRSLSMAKKEMLQATSDIWKAKRYTAVLTRSGGAVLQDLGLMYDACPREAQDYLGNSVSGIESSVRKYNKVALHLADAVVSLPQRLVDAQQAGISMGNEYSWQIAFPSFVLVAIASGVITAAVAIQECAGPKVARRCERCQMPLVSFVVVAPVVVLLCVVASMELKLGIEMSAYCQDADAITLQYAAQEFGEDSPGINMTRYYVTGKGSNEALQRLNVATDDISYCIEWMHRYRVIIEKTCPLWRPWNVTVNLQAVLISLNETGRLLQPAQVYGHYDAVVHDFVCGSAISGLGWIVVSQVSLALLFLPVLTCSAGFLLRGLTLEREMGHRFDLLAQDEETDLEHTGRGGHG